MTDSLARPAVDFDRILAKRALLCALGPLAGLRAEGSVLATASGANVVLPPFTYGVPIIGGRAVYARMVKTLPTTAIGRVPEGTTVTSAGTAVSVRAVCGGPSGNLAAGTPILWQPVPSGIVVRGEVGPAGITGGVAQPGPGRCARVVAYDAMSLVEAKNLLSGAGGEGLPAIVIARSGSAPLERGTVASTLREHRFDVLIVSAHYASEDERSEEGELLLDAVESTLEGLEDVEGDVFSGYPVELGLESRPAMGQHVTAWQVEVKTYHALKRIDVRLTDGVSWQPWVTTRIEAAVPEAGAQPARDLVDVTVEHDQ